MIKNLLKSVFALSLIATFFLSCKDTASNVKPDNLKETSAQIQKTNAVAIKPETTSFKIEGMTCAMGCAKTIEDKLSKMDGVQKAVVDFDKKEATVSFDASVISTKKLIEAVETTGDGATYKVAGMNTKS
ncbi:heavy-metal-associated domain-containing protein [Flavobacterium sp.]|jgi:copper chaperone CopZ|uniref:heavy-metal-associated domain-containing protein n=1 Tax=Flavobacterium sp. TaxID=239 RepID=UPI00391CC38B